MRNDETDVIRILEKNSFKITDSSTWRLEDLKNGGEPKRVLGLQVLRENGVLFWKRAPCKIHSVKTAKDLASALGEAASSHLPCLGPVRAQLSVLRSLLGKFIGNEHHKWNLNLPDDLTALWDICNAEVREERKYEWLIKKSTKFRLYTDASSMLIGGLIRSVHGAQESPDLIDFCSIHRCPHINIAELDGVVFGLQHLENYAPKDSTIEIITDSKSTRSWVAVAISDGIIRTKALNKSLIRHRVQIMKEMFAQNNWKVTVTWVESAKNPADRFTRVPHSFVLAWKAFNNDSTPDEQEQDSEHETTQVVGAIREHDRLRDAHQWDDLIRTYHQEHLHPGQAAMIIGMRPFSVPNLVERVKRILGECVLCRCKRPIIRYENLKTGHPQPDRPWAWLQMDTLSISHQPVLKAIIIIDEYSRWIEVLNISGAPTAADTVKLLEHWRARHKPEGTFHVRADRGTEFRNVTVAKWISDNGGKLHYSTVRRPTACGTVERVNRTLLTLMRTAKHMFPTETPTDWLRRATHEYWNRPHSRLQGATPNERLKATGVFSAGEETLEEMPEDDDLTSSDEDPEKQNAETSSEERSVDQPQDNQREEPSSDEPPVLQPLPLAPRKVLAYIPSEEKLDLGWREATVLQTHQGGALTVLPDNHRVTTLNQQFLQEFPEVTNTEAQPTGNPDVIPEDASLGDSSPRRTSRNRRTPARFME
jgi:transposase InsO family protein